MGNEQKKIVFFFGTQINKTIEKNKTCNEII